METIIGLVRTATPLASVQTVSKVNTYLPIFEKASTLLGMYAFLNRAQNYAPIQSMNAKTPMEKVSALVSSGNLPIGKFIAQPLIANNMDKIISAVSKNLIAPMIKNGNLNLNLSDMLTVMSKQFPNSNESNSADKSEQTEGNSSMDIGSLMETFMPLINNIMSSNTSNSSDAIQEENPPLHSYSEANIVNSQFAKEEDLPLEVKDIPDKIDNYRKKSSENNKSISSTPLEIKPRNRKRKFS